MDHNVLNDNRLETKSNTDIDLHLFVYRCLDYCWKSYCHNNFRKFEQPPVMSTTFEPMTVPLSPPPIVLPPRPSSSPSRATSS